MNMSGFGLTPAPELRSLIPSTPARSACVVRFDHHAPYSSPNLRIRTSPSTSVRFLQPPRRPSETGRVICYEAGQIMCSQHVEISCGTGASVLRLPGNLHGPRANERLTPPRHDLKPEHVLTRFNVGQVHSHRAEPRPGLEGARFLPTDM